jgi:ABC-type transporter Mla subunit MlaD
MARVQSQQILDALDGMRNLGGSTDNLLSTIQALKTTNSEAIRQMRSAAELLRRLLQSRGDMENIMNAVGRHGTDMGENVDRIREALNAEPSAQQMQEAIRDLESASNEALQAGLPTPQSDQPLNGNASPFVPSQDRTVGGYNWRSSGKKSNGKRVKTRKGGYNWRSSGKKTKTKTKTRRKMRTKRSNSSSSSRRSRTRK